MIDCKQFLLFFFLLVSMYSIAQKKEPYLVKMPYVEKDTVFLEKYQDIVFSYKKHEKTTSRTNTRLWREPIHMYFDESVPKKIEKKLLRFADSISSHLDSLTIKRVRKLEESNYIVYFENDPTSESYEPKLKTKGTSFWIYWDGSTLNKAYLKLNNKYVTNPEEQITHLKINFFQSLGYFDKIRKVPCSDYLRNCRKTKVNERSKKYSAFDQEVLDYHYSYGICTGIDRKTFEDFHGNIRAIKDTTDYPVRATVTHQY